MHVFCNPADIHECRYSCANSAFSRSRNFNGTFPRIGRTDAQSLSVEASSDVGAVATFAVTNAEASLRQQVNPIQAGCAVGAEQGVTCNKVFSMCNIFVRHDLQQIFIAGGLTMLKDRVM